MKAFIKILPALISLCILSCQSNEVQLSLVAKPNTESVNSYYISNKAPLVASPLIKLPVGSIKPEGWLNEYLVRQKNGLTGHLGEISAWLQKENNAWLDPNGQGEWGWEEVPYWLKGYANIGYILEDQEMIDEAKIWLEGAINSQQESGFFGPNLAWESYMSDESRTDERMREKLQKRDYWANMIMLYCLQSYYEYSKDERVIDLMTKYFKYQLSIPDENFLSESQYWQRIRGGDNLHSVLWLYNRTGEKWLLELAEKVHRNTAPWNKRGHQLSDIGSPKMIREGMQWPDWYGDLIDWHNVNVAQGFREPAQYFQLSKDPKDLQATYDNFKIVRDHFGQVPGGMFGSDENARPGYADPRQGVETCGMVEQMNSDEHLLRITGDIAWADHAENVAFNTYPAAVAPDFKSLRYITSPNMVVNDNKNHAPGIANRGPELMMNPFSSRCCQHNHSQGWPYFSENLWMATPDNGLAAVIYASSKVEAQVGSQTNVSIHSQTLYPFEDKLKFTITLDKNDRFPLYFRIPSWAIGATAQINNTPLKIDLKEGEYLRIERNWKSGDQVSLQFPRRIQIQNWEANHNSVSINYGPLTFSLKIEEQYVKTNTEKSVQHDSKWQKGADVSKWPSYEIYPNSPWNYGLQLGEDISNSFEIIKRDWPKDNFPFTPQSTPIIIKAKAAIIPQWQLDQYGLAGELMDSPVKTNQAVETVELIPMGAARLRISAFPTIE